MNHITQTPQFIGSYTSWADIESNLKEVLRRMKIKLSELEIASIIDAVKKDSFKLLPEWFQGGRDNMNPKIVKIYTTRNK